MLTLILGGRCSGKHAFAATLENAGTLVELNALVRAHPAESPALLAARVPAAGDCTVLCTEVGCGVVPADPTDTAYRECVGRCACLLAARAQRVYRLCAGIAQRIQ